METRKFKQVPSINRIGGRNPMIPTPVVISIIPFQNLLFSGYDLKLSQLLL